MCPIESRFYPAPCVIFPVSRQSSDLLLPALSEPKSPINATNSFNLDHFLTPDGWRFWSLCWSALGGDAGRAGRGAVMDVWHFKQTFSWFPFFGKVTCRQKLWQLSRSGWVLEHTLYLRQDEQWEKPHPGHACSRWNKENSLAQWEQGIFSMD